MDAHPTVVLNDALSGATDLLRKAGEHITAILVEQLRNESHFADITIAVTGSITDPETGTEVARLDYKLPYKVYWSRDPSGPDGTE